MYPAWLVSVSLSASCGSHTYFWEPFDRLIFTLLVKHEKKQLVASLVLDTCDVT